MPVHHLLEQILNEYIEAAGLQSGQPLFQSVNSLGTPVRRLPFPTLPSPTLAVFAQESVIKVTELSSSVPAMAH
jgi:hypothetical protein